MAEFKVIETQEELDKIIKTYCEKYGFDINID